ncbi:MAG: hypothetical protein CMA53_01610 [Euryarchaeota archaeon]|nr:hypothetical protein [Euryarchaeota archaeon]|tara:strand:- start:6590 stop:19207 length:12618 start_codon:yes stop_codon:yes gene_type:complete
MIQTGIVSKVKIQDVISSQLPEFIQEESPLTIDFLKQYYTSQEYQGSSADISDNLDQYLNVQNLTPEVIVDSAILSVGISTTTTDIVVSSTKGFPNQYGLFKIDDEIITYTGITTNTFTGCIRGFSGITSYHSDSSKEDLLFSTSISADHAELSNIQNLSSLFLKEFYKKFKKTFLPGLEETELKENLDVGTFIGEARSLYQTKGTEESFRILFNVLYGITPKILNLEERLIKPSFASYVRRRVCVAELLEGDPIQLQGQSLLKGLTGQTLFRSDLDLNINASISEIEPFERVDSGLSGITTYYKIGLFVGYDESSDVAGDFIIVPNTKSIENVSIGSSVITVDSTIGFGVTGTILSGVNTITYTDKTINQFLNCSGVTSPIVPIQNIRSDITYFGFEDGNLDNKVVLRLTGVLSEFEQDGNVDVEEGEIISVKSIGDKVKNPEQNKSYKEIFCNSWIYNTSSSYFVTKVESGIIYLDSEIDRSSLKRGDVIDIVDRGSNEILETGAIVNQIVDSSNSITLNNSSFVFLSSGNYKIRKKLNKANSSGTPLEYGNGVITSDVQNVYIQNENAYVTSNSLPSFVNNLSEFSKQINVSVEDISLNLSDPNGGSLTGSTDDQQSFSIINFANEVSFKTGDKVFYSFSDGDSLVGLSTGPYFVEVLAGQKSIKLFGSPSGIADGQNVTFSKDLNDGVHNFILFSQKSGVIGAQKLIKKFPLSQNLSDGNNEETPFGETGMLINGVEISNYKSSDKMYFGPLKEVNVLNGGDNFDVINLPNITISSGVGSTALVQPVVSGKIIDVFVDSQNFDVDKVISIGVTGGNGTGCILEPVVGERFRQELFDSRPTTQGGGINTSTTSSPESRIIFKSDHSFRTGDAVIYDSNFQDSIGVGVGNSVLINQSTYYTKFINSTAIELYESISDLNAGIGTITFNGNNAGGDQIFKVGLRNTLLDVKVIDGGSGYTNRKLIVKPTGISTSNDTINFVNHGFKDGDLIEYSGNISGLDTSKNYYILFNDNDSFSLSDVGIGATDISNYERRKKVILNSKGSGFQEFKYPDIKVTSEFTTIGIGTTAATVVEYVERTIDFTPIVKGSIEQTYLYESGTGYGSTIINNHKKPIVTLKIGKNASVKPNIVNGRINSVSVESVGKEYFSIPDLDIIDPTGKGSGARLRPVVVNAGISTVIVVNAGIGYSTDTSINVKPSGQNSIFDTEVRSLEINKYSGEDNYQLLEDTENKLKYSFNGYDITLFNENVNNPSGLIGWAYDGNPIYGPFAYENPEKYQETDDNKVKKLISSYVLDTSNIVDRPSGFFDGFFIGDYKFDNSIGDLDEHNGRFEITQEFPNGSYVYHATVSGGSNTPSFPYFIGNSYRSKSIQYNVDNNLQTNFDFNSNNLIRNTFPYKVADNFANNDFLVETNEIQDQKIEITSVSSGSVTGFDIISGGLNYKVNEFLNFDNNETDGNGLISVVSSIDGKPISTINTQVGVKTGSVVTWSEKEISVFTESNHDFKNNDFVKISGLSTDISQLNNSFKIGVTTFSSTTISTISPSPSAGFTTEIFVTDIPNFVSAGSSIGIGTETLKILNIYKNLNVITVQRGTDSGYAATHPEGTNILYLSNKFTINKSLPYFETNLNKKVFFNPSQTVGLGTDDGSENALTFSFAGQNITRNVPVKQIYIENHPFKTNQRIKFSTPTGGAGQNIAISTDKGISTFNLPETLFAVNKNINSIGIKTGIGTNFSEVHFITVPSISEDLRDRYLFETVFDEVTAKTERIETTVTTTESHELETGDSITLRVEPNLSVGIGTSTEIKVSRDLVTGNILLNPVGFNSSSINTSNNSIRIINHGFKTGDKIKYESNFLPEGLENKNYFVYKFDDDAIKLCETQLDVKRDIPKITGIGSTGGSTQSISLINPKVEVIKNNDLIFNLSDSSLTGYDFKIYYDQEFRNDYISVGVSTIFGISTSGSNGSVGAALTIGYGSSIPNSLFYNLEKSGTISTTDNDVKDYSKISFVDSLYEDTYQITKVSDTSFKVFIKDNPEKLSYNSVDCDVLKYNTSSKTAKGSINSVNIISGGSNYKKIPNFIGVGGTSIGKESVLIPTSNTIGNIEQVRIINEGFEYSSDKTLEPESLIADTVNISNTNTLGIVSVTNGGSDFIDTPNIIVVNTETGEQIKSGFLEPIMSENSISSVEIAQRPIGLPEKVVTIRTINNSNGIVITDVISNNSGIFTCRISTPNPVFAEDPFSVNDKVFIEGIERVSIGGSGFNSKDYGYKLLTVSKYEPNVTTQGQVTIDVSNLTSSTGIAKTVVDTFANVINESDYPSFFVTQNQSTFDVDEKLVINDTKTNSKVVRSNIGKLKIFGTNVLNIGDKLVGENSGSQCNISSIKKNKGRLKTDFSILKNLSWSDNIGKLNEDFQVIPDNDYYQNMSYSVQSPIQWKSLRTPVNNLLHTSGMKNFADTGISSTSNLSIGSSSYLNVVVDLTEQKRVDEIRNLDFARDTDINGNISRFISFDNLRLSDYVSCKTNDVLIMDDISNEFSNLQGNPDNFLELFNFSDSVLTELFNDLIIVTKSSSSSSNKIQISNLLLLSNGNQNVLVEKSNLINSGNGPNTSDDVFADFLLNKNETSTTENTLRFIPKTNPIPGNEVDYDLKIFSSQFNTTSTGVGTTSIGPINLTSGIQLCPAGITTNIISVPVNEFESLYATIHVIDDVTKEMNLIESFVSHSGTDTFLTEAYFNTQKNEFSTNKLGIITSSISNNNLILSYQNNELSTLKLKSRVIGIGTTGVSDGTFRFKSPGQNDGSERTSKYTGISTRNVGVSTILNLDSNLFNSVKSVVEVSIGSSKAVHEVLFLHDGTDAYAQQSGSLSVTKDYTSEYDPSSGLGTFGAILSGSNFILEFHPDNSSGISTVVALNHCLYTKMDTVNDPDDHIYGVITESNSVKLYNSLEGDRIERTQFTPKVNSIPIFGKVFNPDSVGLNSVTGQFSIDNHFFRENEQLVYKPNSSFVGVGSTPMQFEIKSGGISTISQLPTTVFAKNVTNDSFFISTTRAGAAVSFISLGEGNVHELNMSKANEKILVSLDEVGQYPLIRSNITHTLSHNLSGSVGLTTTIIHLSGISTLTSSDLLKIDDEFVEITNVGFATTGGGPVGSSGTFNTVEVTRSFVGSAGATHSDGTTVTVFRGSYNINGRDLFFTNPPRGDLSNSRTINDLLKTTTKFSGRVYLRNDYSTNVIYDDVSDQFTGIKSDFTVTVGGSNTIGIGSTGGSGILFVNGVFQSPSTFFNPNKNFKIIESGSGATGVTTVIFTGITSNDGSVFTSNNINTNELPRGGVPVSIGNTINGLGYAPLVGANVKALTNASGQITSIVGTSYSGSNLGVQTATYNNVTGIMTIRTVNEHKFIHSNDFAILQGFVFSPSLTLKSNEYEIISIASTNVFSVRVGAQPTSFNYQGSGKVYPFFPRLTVGSGYNDIVSIGVTVIDVGYEHRFISANANSITGNLTPIDASYNSFTGELQITAPNHGLTNSSSVGITTGSMFFSCSKDNFQTVHPYPRSTDPVAGVSTAVTKLTDDIFSINVGVNVGSGASISASVGVGGTLAFSIVSAGTSYKDPKVVVSEPSYSNLSVTGVSRLGFGATTDTGTDFRVNAIPKPSVGIGSTLFEITEYEIVNKGFGFKRGDVIEAVGLVTAKGVGQLVERSTLTVDKIFNDSFALWQFGDFDYIDSIKDLQNSSRTDFSIILNNQLISFERDGNTLNQNVKLENLFLVIVNGVIQDPATSYSIIGGNIISFSEAPIPEDDISILFYKGTTNDDSIVRDKEKITIEVGDEVKLSRLKNVKEQNKRTVFNLNTSQKLETNAYQDVGISSVSRPISLIKQKEDKIINKTIVSKKRQSIEPRITPTAKIIGDVTTTDTTIFVDSMDLFNYESGTTSLGLSILKKDQFNFINAGATATVSTAGTVTGFSTSNFGSGYATAPIVKLSVPSSGIGVGIGTTATATATIGAGGTVTTISVVNPGLGYTIAPKVLISSPVTYSNTFENLTTPTPGGSLSIQNNTGSITGIGTTILSSKLGIKFTIKRNSSLSDFNPISVGNPIYIFDTRVGSGVIGIDTHGNNTNSVGIGTSFADSIYSIAAFQDLTGGVGVITCLIKSDTNVSGMISSGSAVGKYSVGRISGFSRGSNAVSIGVTGFTIGLIESIGITTYPTLKRTEGPKTFENTGSIIPEI